MIICVGEPMRRKARCGSAPSRRGVSFRAMLMLCSTGKLSSMSRLLFHRGPWGISPEHVIGVDGHVPDPQGIADPARRAAIETALDYMGLKPGAPIIGTPVDWVFIGSCTNSRLSDLRAAAEVVRGRKVAPGVRAWVVPGSETVKRDAVAEGLDKLFTDAGFEWREPGCSMCLAANGETVPPGQRSVSTSNRNFIGRQGPRARTHLASPATAAASAISGAIADVRMMEP